MFRERLKKILEFMLYVPSGSKERTVTKNVVDIPGYDKFVLKVKPNGEEMDTESCQISGDEIYDFLIALPRGVYEALEKRIVVNKLMESYTLDELNKMYYPVARESNREENVRKRGMRKILEESILIKSKVGYPLTPQEGSYPGNVFGDRDLPNSRGEPEEEITGP
jgi:hypothetical protein